MQSTQAPNTDRRYNASAVLMRAIVLAVPAALVVWVVLAVRF